MIFERIDEFFEGAASKYLTAVDAESVSSNQHEIGGLVKAGFGKYLGFPQNGKQIQFRATVAYLDDEQDDPVIVEDFVTWYDCRENDPSRSSEYRLYYKENEVTSMRRKGQLFLIAKMANGGLLIIFCPRGSSIENQLSLMFGISSNGKSFKSAKISDMKFDLPVRLLFEEIGIDIDQSSDKDTEYLDEMLHEWRGIFPKTKILSDFTREKLNFEDPETAPDDSLIEWMDLEERLFKIYEKNVAELKFEQEFGTGKFSFEEFIKFSLSVHNRRKSRAGFAFENHLEYLFERCSLRFTRDGKTENKSNPDFLFPGESEYHSPEFPQNRLRMLALKTSCKDRWRQVLTEAEKIPRKHLITLQQGITENQTNEMESSFLQLVIPKSIQYTYTKRQQEWLYSLSDFIEEVRSMQEL